MILDFKGEYGDFIDHYKRLADGKQAIVYVHSVAYADKSQNDLIITVIVQ